MCAYKWKKNPSSLFDNLIKESEDKSWDFVLNNSLLL